MGDILDISDRLASKRKQNDKVRKNNEKMEIVCDNILEDTTLAIYKVFEDNDFDLNDKRFNTIMKDQVLVFLKKSIKHQLGLPSDK